MIEKKLGEVKISEINSHLELQIKELEEQVTRIGYNLPKSMNFDRLKELTDKDKLTSTLNDLITLQEILTDTPVEIPNQNQEWKFLERALSKFGLRVKDDFWSILEKDNIIEIYGSDMRQKYRSFNFFNTTSYSLVDLTIYEWYVLWDRPKQVLDRLIEVAQDVVDGKRGLDLIGVPKHLLREIHDNGTTQPFQPRSLLVEMRYIAPLFKSVGNEIGGFIVTSNCEVIDVGNDVLDIDFI